ncbi:glycosyltransferase family 4 protein [Phocoenobacter skyensis]|uniref:Glycosyltransferase family 4 protein n=1 Tax=Phocoenobacter skyensis TaxID=97481 RepID=A0A1H7WII0_9PAST|nr:glycosyltransferase family 4 protein [Pasteurella skyensis]MDP8079230.1 glycosyltransferase family 4 protein [Pasteurella skyensis]MDP8085160.1 glycosyltransferase family 4 protein [Pasteurella skyensis]MDP8185077.1 glycosyltransferase family 4 protein [Pasteurella skyensis]QLB22237.1 alpha-D-quinac alpha-1,3-galactosyltransferase [Pasteurella skyensis]SEM20808.1 Glycosyltransferase involved in cell wall bisynthesis [Pasteurella skyensis]
MKKKLLIVVNVDWFFISHRLCIVEEAVKQDWDVYVACADTGRSKEIIDNGINYINLPLSRSGMNPFQELKTLISLFKIYKKIQPDVVHQVTMKPVVYGSVVAKILKIKNVVNAISGLGYNFTSKRKSFTAKSIIRLMKYGFKRENLTIIFQNSDDERELKKLGAVYEKNKIVRIKGSGVDLDTFLYSDFPTFNRIKILFPARMLWDKGVKELKEATDLLKLKYQYKIQFILCGLADTENKAGVTEEYMNNWQDGDYVKWIGYHQDMVQIYKDSHIVVLPSYREGMPKSLLEACAIGRPIVTTNATGCDECVEDGENGFKVSVSSSKELAEAIEKLVNNEQLIKSMAIKSRKKAEKEFDVKNVIAKHIEIYNKGLE